MVETRGGGFTRIYDNIFDPLCALRIVSFPENTSETD